MAIVPLTKDVSIRTIRDVINQKAVVLGQMRYRGTTYGRYGNDQSTGYVQVVLKNTQSADSITLKVDLKRNGDATNRTITSTLAPGQKKYFTFSGLKGKIGGFDKHRDTGYKPAASYEGNHDYDLLITELYGEDRSESINNINITTSGGNMRYEHVVALFNKYPITNISMVTSTASVTANNDLKDGVQIPDTLTDSTSGRKLSLWRGSQVIHGHVVTRTSGTARYGADNKKGVIHVYLDPRGFSNGPVTVTIPNVRTITKNISNTNNRLYKFESLKSKNYTLYIKDEITGTNTIKKFNVGRTGYNAALRHNSYSFNGTSQMLAFTF